MARMPTFRCELVHGAKTPYDTWTFVIVPDDVRRALGGNARIPVRGTVAGAPIRATISKGEGVHRFAVTRDVQDAAGVDRGPPAPDRLDLESHGIEMPGRSGTRALGEWTYPLLAREQPVVARGERAPRREDVVEAFVIRGRGDDRDPERAPLVR